MIYLDNAATSYPKPESVINAMVYAQKYVGANAGRGGHRMTARAGEMVYSARDKAGNMFNCESERVIFTCNCTASLNTAIKGTVQKGDHVIVSCLEHNSVLRPVHYLAEKGIITYSVAEVDPLSEEKTVRNFISLIKNNTVVVICTMVSNVFGTVLPTEKLGAELAKRGITFIVDAAQSAGTYRIDMKRMNIDILCVPGHKGLFGPMGTGMVLIGDEADVAPLCQGGTGSFSMSASQPDVYPDKLESGTVNLPGIWGLKKGMDYISSVGGEEAIHRKEAYLCKILREDLSVIRGVELYGNIAGKNPAPLVALNLKNLHSERVADMLNDKNIAVRAGYHCAYLSHHTCGTENSGVLRVSPGWFNTKKDIKNFVFSLNKIAKRDNL
ncbi:MAG: aminotransferase class V-fold PLP-dependent enzyme [Clostridia bacterium]|nr:aminotransferase class V-fold PLP-dependent enzyme [Clostridia bacterium]